MPFIFQNHHLCIFITQVQAILSRIYLWKL